MVQGEKLAEGDRRKWTDPELVVDEALDRACSGRRRTWDGRKPLTSWLKGVVRSVASEGLPRTPRKIDGNAWQLLRSKGVSEESLLALYLFSNFGKTKGDDSRHRRGEIQKKVALLAGMPVGRLKAYPKRLRGIALEIDRLNEAFLRFAYFFGDQAGDEALDVLATTEYLNAWANLLEKTLPEILGNPSLLMSEADRRLQAGSVLYGVRQEAKQKTGEYLDPELAHFLGISEVALRQRVADAKRRLVRVRKADRK